MIPQQIEVIKAFDCRQYRFKSFRIRVGEIGNYFEHADVYNFEAREGYVPYESCNMPKLLPIPQ